MPADQYTAFLTDIENRGIQTPLEITQAGIMIDGHQRLRAAIDLNHDTVPTVVVSPEDEVEYMLLAALRRRQLSASQRAALAVDLDQLHERRLQARERSRANLRRGEQSPEEATLPPRHGKSRDHAARLAGVSPRTLQDALTVRDADPALFERVKNGEIAVHLASRRVKRARRDTTLPPAPALPTGRFQVIYADPPWQLGNPDGPYAPENHYLTLPLADIIDLNPPTTDDAVLYLWAVNSLLPEALHVMASWGFTYKTNYSWDKLSISLGIWNRQQHELLLVGRKGNCPPPDSEDRSPSVVRAKRGRHSEKPGEFYEIIERAYPGASKLELFARGPARPGWITWGNEAEEAA